MDSKTIEQLQRLGHEVGQSTLNHDGNMLLAIDGRMLTYPEIDKLLADGLKITEIERKVIDILVKHETSPDAWSAPIHAVDRAMGWATAKTEEYVRDLMKRDLVHWEAIPGEGLQYEPKCHWKEGRLR